MTATYYRILAVGWSLAILVAYSVPTTGLPSSTLLQIDKAAHFVMFLGFGFLWMHAIHPRRPDAQRKATSPVRAFALIGVGIGLSVLAELYQTMLPRRAAEPYDAAANILGVAVAVGAFWWWYPSRTSRDLKQTS
ncbi:MAG: hypothetical protein GVY35_15580 [Bacteroidetes bacterium]|jgi:VanZ family protein|nr:hypothetical protein [Bacteroidota bacterium]